jgi:hypothetical protein
MDKKVPHPVVNYLKDQVSHKKKPIQKSIQNTYNYWKTTCKFIEENLIEDEALRLFEGNSR